MSFERVQTVVLAAGRGVRMKSNRPKVLHEVLGLPLIRYVLGTLTEAGIEPSRTMIVVGFERDRVRAACGEEGYRYLEQNELRGTGDAVLRAQALLTNFEGELLVINGDQPLISAKTLHLVLEAHRSLKAEATFLSACIEDPKGYGRVVRDKESGRFARIVEEADASPAEKSIAEINAGVYIFRAPAIFDVLSRVTCDNRKNEYYLTHGLNLLASGGAKVEIVRCPDPGEAFGVSNRRDLVVATNFLRWKILEQHMDKGVTVIDPSTTYIEGDVQIGWDTVIQPFCVIRRGVVVGGRCEVGPFAHLRAGTILEDHAEIGNFVEVKKSRIGARSKAKHLTYLGDAVVGRDVNIGAGTITANFDGVRKNETILEDEVQTGSNTVLVAPVRLGRGVKTGAGAVVLKGAVPPGEIVVGVPAKSMRRKR